MEADRLGAALAICKKLVQLDPLHRSIRKPSSFGRLSLHARTMTPDPEPAVAVRFVGAAAAEGAVRIVRCGRPDAAARGAQIDRGGSRNFVAAAGNGNIFGIGINNASTQHYLSSYKTTAAAGYDAVIPPRFFLTRILRNAS